MKYVLQKRLRGRRIVFVLASRPRRRRSAAALRSTGTAVTTLYLLRRLGRGSGLSPGEPADALPGDAIVTDPMWQSTRAITIEAPPEQVWPWVVQMGYPSHRAGWYTPHWLDRLTFGIEQRSADRVVPELQHLETGDRVPDSDDWSVYFTVIAIDPPRSLVLYSSRHVIRPIRTINFSWAFVIREVVPGKSRLFIRARTSYTPRWAMPFVELVVGPADFVNAGSMLRGIKKRAEAASARPGPADTDDAGVATKGRHMSYSPGERQRAESSPSRSATPNTTR